MRIYDTFLFGGELDLLEHRLRETFDLVDAFVLVEAAETFRGAAKPLVFRDHAGRFVWAAEKIRHIALESLGPAPHTAWQREALQRNALMLGLGDASPDDIVLVLDADEIADHALLMRLRQTGVERPHRLAMTRHHEFLDSVAPASACCPDPEAPFAFHAGRIRPGAWPQPGAAWQETTGIAVRYRDLCGDPQAGLPARSAYEMRRLMHGAPVLENAGRHFVSTDPAMRNEVKLARVSHEELSDSRTLAAEHLHRVRRHGVHHHGWWYAETPAGTLPADLERLAQRFPALKRQQPLPGPVRRRLVRTWSWLRFWPLLPDRFVRAVDGNFERLTPLLIVPLLAADLLRALGAHAGWRWMSGLSTQAARHTHHV